MPGAMIRNPREKCLLFGRRAALTVCQAISIAMTVVLPAPVASFRATRRSSGLAWERREFFAPLSELRRDLVNQTAVSTASIWQKKGRWLWKSDAASAGAGALFPA
jgi:hypothetical protein